MIYVYVKIVYVFKDIKFSIISAHIFSEYICTIVCQQNSVHLIYNSVFYNYISAFLAWFLSFFEPIRAWQEDAARKSLCQDGDCITTNSCCSSETFPNLQKINASNILNRGISSEKIKNQDVNYAYS